MRRDVATFDGGGEPVSRPVTDRPVASPRLRPRRCARSHHGRANPTAVTADQPRPVARPLRRRRRRARRRAGRLHGVVGAEPPAAARPRPARRPTQLSALVDRLSVAAADDRARRCPVAAVAARGGLRGPRFLRPRGLALVDLHRRRLADRARRRHLGLRRHAGGATRRHPLAARADVRRGPGGRRHRLPGGRGLFDHRRAGLHRRRRRGRCVGVAEHAERLFLGRRLERRTADPRRRLDPARERHHRPSRRHHLARRLADLLAEHARGRPQQQVRRPDLRESERADRRLRPGIMCASPPTSRRPMP